MEPSEFRAVNSRSYLLLLITIGIVGLDFFITRFTVYLNVGLRIAEYVIEYCR